MFYARCKINLVLKETKSLIQHFIRVSTYHRLYILKSNHQTHLQSTCKNFCFKHILVQSFVLFPHPNLCGILNSKFHKKKLFATVSTKDCFFGSNWLAVQMQFLASRLHLLHYYETNTSAASHYESVFSFTRGNNISLKFTAHWAVV